LSVRKFKAGHRIEFLVGSSYPATAFTHAALVWHGAASNEWHMSYKTAASLDAGSYYSVGAEGGLFTVYANVANSKLAGAIPRETWCLFVVTKAAGSAKPTFYIYRFDTEAWTVAAGGTALADIGGAPDTVRFGQWNNGEQFLGKMAAQAVWNSALSEAQVKSLITGSIESWLALSPKALWMLDQEVVTEEVKDATGNGADQKAREGTEVVAEMPPIPYKEEGEGGGKPVKVKVGGELVAAKRSVVVGGELVPA
jgi:hypothetical protein